MNFLIYLSDKNELLFKKNEILIYALILHWLLMIFLGGDNLKMNKILFICCSFCPCLLFVHASPGKHYHFGNCWGEIIFVVKVTNSEDCTIKVFVAGDLKSGRHICHQISLP